MEDAKLGRILGNIDSLDKFVVRGWVQSATHPEEHLVVQIIADDVLVAEINADMYRSDLSEAGIGDGHYAFEFDMPVKFFDGRSRVIDVTLLGSDFRFPNVPCEVLFSAEETVAQGIVPEETGDIDVVVSAEKSIGSSSGEARIVFGLSVEGWYVNAEKPGHVFKVDALENGRVLASAFTTQICAFAPHELQDQRCGYRLALPAELLDGKEHRITFAFDGVEDEVSFVTIDGMQTGIGFVDQIAAKTIAGWAVSYSNTAQPVMVEALCRGVIYGRTLANIFREDLTGLSSLTGFQGFEVTLNRPLFKEDLDNLTVQIADSKFPLSWADNARPQALAELEARPLKPRLKGFIDNLNTNGIAGWAYDLDDPTRRIRVNLSVGGCKIAGVVADAGRSDLAKAFGTDGCHGFHLGFPPMLGLKGTVNVEITFAETGQMIGKQQVEFPERASSKIDGYAGLQRYLYRPPVAETTNSEPLVHVIVLNRNGDDHLKAMLQSFHTFNSYSSYMITIVDHGSTDASSITVEQWKDTLNVKFLNRGRNYSFSESNNLAKDFPGDYVLFLNNDIIFVQCILSGMVKLLGDAAVGMVGIKLRSPPSSDGEAFQSEGFVQHLGVKFGALADENTIGAYELPLHPDTLSVSNAVWTVPAVTAAAMMMRKDDFVAVGGFDEGYFYGYEDVDLCLKLTRQLGKTIVCANNIVALHHRGATRTNEDAQTRQRYSKNLTLLKSRFGASLRQQIRREILQGERFTRIEPLKVAFLVSTTDMAAPEADFFTAFELGEEMAALKGWTVSYLPPNSWYDLSEFDVVIAMRQDWDPNRMTSSNPNMLKVAWARNWFDRWLTLPWLESFDLIWAASGKAASAFRANTKKPVEVFRIATSAKRFQNVAANPDFASDYCFTGSFFKAPREIVSVLDPDSLPYSFNLFGHNWGQFPRLRKYWRGALPYLDMPKVYGSVRVVIDDCNTTVKEWGSVNSRVFDALAAGALVISNGRVGSEEVFDGDLPCYESKQNFAELLDFYLSDDAARLLLVDKLREKVLSAHTYAHRAAQAVDSLTNVFGQLRANVRFDHKSPPNEIMARLLADSLREQGFWVRMESLSKSEQGIERLGDDVVFWVSADTIPIYGLMPDQINVLFHTTLGVNASASNFDLLILPDAACNLSAAQTPTISLFENASEREKAFGLDAGIFVYRDGRLLRDALTKQMRPITESIHDINRRKTDVPAASAVSGLTLEEIGSKYGVHLVVYPDYRKTNPYQRLLYQNLPAGYDVEFGDITRAIDSQRKLKEKTVVFHLHWTSTILGLEQSPQIAETKLEKFIAMLELFIGAGGHLAWTIHNILPHELRHPELEARLCNKLAQLASNIHVHSLGVPSLVADHYHLPENKVVLGAHGNYIGTYADFIDRSSARSKIGLSEEDVVYLFTGQLRSYKGIEDLISAFRAVTHPLARLLIVGSPVNMSMTDLRARINQDKRIHLIEEHVADDDLQIYLRSADFVVLPYERILTSGSVYLALSFGVPVIASDGGLIPEIISDGVNGFLFRSGDVTHLQSVIERSLELSPEAKLALGEAAMASAEKNDWNATQTTLLRNFLATTICSPTLLQVGQERRRVFIRQAQTPPTAPRVAAVVLHYNDLADTVRCVLSLLAQTGELPHIYIVSNELDAVSFAYLCERFPNCTVVQCDDNLGYAGGNNVALALIANTTVDFIWLINPDTVVPADFLQRMTVLADTNGDTMIFGSKILFGDRPDVIWFGGGEISWKDGFESKHRYIGKRSVDMPDTPTSSDYITGASIFFRKEVVDTIGFIPERYFLYFEETHWCILASKAGLAMKIFPETELFHHKRSEDGGVPTPIFLYYYCRNALILCAEFHPEALAETQKRLLETASLWLERVRVHRPDMLALSTFVIDLGLQHGLEGLTGRVDFMAKYRDSLKAQEIRRKAS